jgi:hypothetical protein
MAYLPIAAPIRQRWLRQAGAAFGIFLVIGGYALASERLGPAGVGFGNSVWEWGGSHLQDETERVRVTPNVLIPESSINHWGWDSSIKRDVAYRMGASAGSVDPAVSSAIVGRTQGYLSDVAKFNGQFNYSPGRLPVIVDHEAEASRSDLPSSRNIRALNIANLFPGYFGALGLVSDQYQLRPEEIDLDARGKEKAERNERQSSGIKGQSPSIRSQVTRVDRHQPIIISLGRFFLSVALLLCGFFFTILGLKHFDDDRLFYRASLVIGWLLSVSGFALYWWGYAAEALNWPV